VAVEHNQLIFGVLGLGVALVYSYIQALGGRAQEELPGVLGKIKNRVWGRWIAPLFFSSSVCLLAVAQGTFHPIFLLSIVAYKLSTHIGYGAESTAGKIVRRTLWSLIRTACSLSFAIVTGAWTIYVSQVIVGLVMAVIWGVRNPTKSPREEQMITFSNIFLVPTMVMV